MGRKIAELGVYAATLPWIRYEMPAWGKFYNFCGLGVFNEIYWQGAGWRKLRLKDSECEVWLDLSSNFERITYFLGRYQELELELVMQAVLREGDQFVDGGANIGLLSLLAAKLVERGGKVIAFEPNPDVLIRIKEHVDINGLTQIELHPCGLSDETAELTFRIINGGAETGTMAALADEELNAVTAEQRVKVRKGDDVLLGSLSPARRTLIKLDVEGFEMRAVKGMLGVIDRCQPVLITEYQHHLTPPDDLLALFDMLCGRGYAAFGIGLQRSGVLSHRLKLNPLQNAAELQGRTEKTDVLWLRPEAFEYFQSTLERA
ncbi:FkbM family methyltransferase [Hyphococcus sp.]|uniref:FkbM family methyltransferase n=1 Tax=Hyphococcus sp. TaxID=2038636 RepID=UPI00207DA830|nr:MAG: hypothetical protein DHS20C04_09840 [Marinicaulis sp.]